MKIKPIKMKKILTSLYLILCFQIGSFAQDLIVKKNQVEIESKIIEITENVIKYKKWTFLEGPIYSVKKSDVFLVLYANGEKEYYGSEDSSQQNNNNAIVSTITNSPVQEQYSSENQSLYSYDVLNKLNVGFSGVGYEGYDVFALAYSYSSPVVVYSSNSALEYDALVGLSFGSFESEFVESDLYLVSLGLGVGYSYFSSENFRVSFGLGYAYSYGGIDFYYDDFVEGDDSLEISSGGLYYYSNIDYFLSDTFGVNLRYDYVSGVSFGIQWIK